MKKVLLLGLILSGSISYTSPNCLEHSGPRFRKAPLERVSCNCPCRNYPRSGHADGYKCLVCGHLLLPEDIQSQKSVTTSKTFNEFKERYSKK